MARSKPLTHLPKEVNGYCVKCADNSRRGTPTGSPFIRFKPRGGKETTLPNGCVSKMVWGACPNHCGIKRVTTIVSTVCKR